MGFFGYDFHINFDTVGLALLTISLIFPIFDKLTEKTIGEFKDLQDEMSKKLKDREGELDEINTRIDDKKTKLLERSALSDFRLVIALSFGFILFSAFNNKCGTLGSFIITLIYLIGVVIYLYKKTNGLIRERSKSKKIIKDCMDIMEDPVKGLKKKTNGI